MNNTDDPLFQEWSKLQAMRDAIPWYKDWMNWALIVCVILIMGFGVFLLDRLGGGGSEPHFRQSVGAPR